MKKAVALFLVAVVVLSFAGCRKASDENRVRRVVTGIQAAGEKKDIGAFMSFISKDYHDPRGFNHEAIRALGRGAVATAASGPADFDFADHKVLIEDMARAVSTGADPAITAASARNTLETALAMYKSAKLGKDVTLPLADEEDIW